MGFWDKAKAFGETWLDVPSGGLYSAGKERLGGKKSSSYLAKYNPLLQSKRAQDEATAQRSAGLDKAIEDAERLGEEQKLQRAKDMSRIMGFYGPAISEMERLYGIPASAWGGGTAEGMAAEEAALAANRQPLAGKFNSTMGKLASPLGQFDSTMAGYRDKMGLPPPRGKR